MATINESLHNFVFDLLRTIGDPQKDAFFSPTSINLCLAMCYGGAKNSTKQQMQNRFYGNDAGDDDVHTNMERILAYFQTASAEIQGRFGPEKNVFELTAANRLYCQKDFEIQQQFRDFVETRYMSGILPVDFKNEKNRDLARCQINQWVEQTTHAKIKDLIGAGDVTEDTRLVLVNALYFKGAWLKFFNENSTTKVPFFANPSKTVDVDTMTITDKFDYFEDATFQAVFLPYADYRAKLLIILPKEKFGLEKLEKNVSGATMEHLAKSQCCEVVVQIPKWKTEQSFKLADALKALGVDHAFDEHKADFSAITGKKDLFISQVLHKAFIEVDEKGTEAAAATAAILACSYSAYTGPPIIPKKFTADHPFLYAIMSEGKGNNDILFLGHYTASEI